MTPDNDRPAHPETIRSRQGEIIGRVWQSGSSWFAEPRNSQVQPLWAPSKAAALDIVQKLGRAHP